MFSPFTFKVKLTVCNNNWGWILSQIISQIIVPWNLDSYVFKIFIIILFKYRLQNDKQVSLSGPHFFEYIAIGQTHCAWIFRGYYSAYRGDPAPEFSFFFLSWTICWRHDHHQIKIWHSSCFWCLASHQFCC